MHVDPDAPRSAPTTDAVRELVRSECARASNRFGPAFLDQHVLRVVDYGTRLAQLLGADRQVVELAGYLHDLAAIRDLACVPTHHRDGARVARDLLAAAAWPAATVDAVCRCIESHSAPIATSRGTVEEVCVSNADLMAQLARPAYWFFYLYRVRGLDYEEALAWWRSRLELARSGLVDEARAIVATEHRALVRLVEDGAAR